MGGKKKNKSGKDKVPTTPDDFKVTQIYDQIRS